MKKNLLFSIISLVLTIAFDVCGYLCFYFKNDWFNGNKALSIILFILGAITLLLCFWYFHLYRSEKYDLPKMNVKKMTIIASLSAITILLYYVAKFNLPFFPGWLDIQISEVPAIIAGFIYGPVSGILIILIRFFIKVPASITFGVGELADLLLGVSIVLITSLIYRRHRTLKGALMASLIGIVVCTILACLSNYLILIPAYVNLAGYSLDKLSLMLKYMGDVTAANFMVYYIFLGVLPFNLFRYLIVFIIVFLIYKKAHLLFDKISQ